MPLWKIKNTVYNLPFRTKKEVLNFVNTDIKLCPVCNKVDCSLSHVDKCTTEFNKYTGKTLIIQ